jgi:hypothetical protein
MNIAAVGYKVHAGTGIGQPHIRFHIDHTKEYRRYCFYAKLVEVTFLTLDEIFQPPFQPLHFSGPR